MKLLTQDPLHSKQESYPLQQREGQVGRSFYYLHLSKWMIVEDTTSDSKVQRETMRGDRNKLQQGRLDNIAHNEQDQSL